MKVWLLPYASERNLSVRGDMLSEALAECMNLGVELEIVPDFDELADALGRGEAGVAVAPPWVVAKARAHLRSVYTCVRAGHATHMAAVIGRRGTKLKQLVGGRAAWVDRRAMAGCLLPRRWLRDNGLEPDVSLTATYVESFSRALEQVRRGDADVTAVRVQSATTEAFQAAVDAVLDEGAHRNFECFGFSQTVPADALVMTEPLGESRAAVMGDGLLARGRGRLRSAFCMLADAEGFEPSSLDNYCDAIAQVAGDASAA